MAKKILFIEDESALQRTVGDLLTSAGYMVIPALTGDDGIRLSMNETPDLILLDLVLPQKDGFEVLTKIRSTNETKDTPVIVLTNLEGSGEVERALSLGAHTYLVKLRYSLDEVLEKIKKALGD
ncbi:MAG: hypothetical protein A3J54_00775 [Candidatus Ryanbacteria bacterium RIFCSPHIGHO2_02_FULL_45_13b]|uniref:Response regulatory domain-containing protein n=1 Tax=Candidatus Ryanbacteria bacterium RIFCSPHIGHO2_02_FULL_45_13b TaxID=1802117 RepID=A0A1G2G6A1_9BACT|nr:MAG: hypothetical protein A3J54_00775 [Candidatus Ryanbacteria bacterium RIFCSPHIGHO2_02_FULL_45_13b]